MSCISKKWFSFHHNLINKQNMQRKHGDGRNGLFFRQFSTILLAPTDSLVLFIWFHHYYYDDSVLAWRMWRWCLFADLNNNNRTNLTLSSRPACRVWIWYSLIFVPTTTHPSSPCKQKHSNEFCQLSTAQTEIIIRCCWLLHRSYGSKCVRRRGKFCHSCLQKQRHICQFEWKQQRPNIIVAIINSSDNFSISFDRSAAWHLLAWCTLFFSCSNCVVDAIASRYTCTRCRYSLVQWIYLANIVQLMHTRADRPWIFYTVRQTHIQTNDEKPEKKKRRKKNTKKNKELEI